MSFLLHIDTAVETASVCLSKDEKVIAEKINPSQKDSASWLHTAIQELLEENNITSQQLAAVAVSSGPGSYTGLRVGFSAAKGLCYALNIPLLTVNTLLQMAASALPQAENLLLCPMIDARRMEVFTAIYDTTLYQLQPASNLILEATSFSDILAHQKILFFGNGSSKAGEVIIHPNAFFASISTTARHLVPLGIRQFLNGEVANLAYAEPFYGKAFFTPVKTAN